MWGVRLAMELESVLIAPMVSEKSWQMQDARKYSFRVHPQANKLQVKKAVESIFKVKVEHVWMMNYLGKPRRRRFYQQGRTAHWKKAIVKLAEGQRIEIYQ